jgi:formylmethanofuran dehydrogenase subunit E
VEFNQIIGIITGLVLMVGIFICLAIREIWTDCSVCGEDVLRNEAITEDGKDYCRECWERRKADAGN